MQESKSEDGKKAKWSKKPTKVYYKQRPPMDIILENSKEGLDPDEY